MFSRGIGVIENLWYKINRHSTSQPTHIYQLTGNILTTNWDYEFFRSVDRTTAYQVDKSWTVLITVSKPALILLWDMRF